MRSPIGEPCRTTAWSARPSRRRRCDRTAAPRPAGSYRNADVDAGALRADVDSFGLDVYGGWRSGDVFVNAAAGVAQDDFNDVNRLTSLAPIVHSGSDRKSVV